MTEGDSYSDEEIGGLGSGTRYPVPADRLHEVALNLAIVCGVHEQSTAYEVIVATLDSYAKEELESFVGFLAHAHPDDWRRWVDAARSQR